MDKMGSGLMHVKWRTESLSDGASLKGVKHAKQLLIESNKRSEIIEMFDTDLIQLCGNLHYDLFLSVMHNM